MVVGIDHYWHHKDVQRMPGCEDRHPWDSRPAISRETDERTGTSSRRTQLFTCQRPLRRVEATAVPIGFPNREPEIIADHPPLSTHRISFLNPCHTIRIPPHLTIDSSTPFSTNCPHDTGYARAYHALTASTRLRYHDRRGQALCSSDRPDRPCRYRRQPRSAESPP